MQYFGLATAFLVYDLDFKEYPSVLFTSKCRLPCWNNITVGSTTILDAKKLMEATVGKANVDYNDYIQLVGFSIPFDKLGIYKTHGYIRSNGGRVTEIELDGNLGINVEEIFANIGTPE